MVERTQTLIIGGGQAGLALSHFLTQAGHDHVVLEAADRPGDAWRRRWDSFTLVTPNWTIRLPGMPYAGADPDGFLPRDEIIALFERYAAHLPVIYGARATAVGRRELAKVYSILGKSNDRRHQQPAPADGSTAAGHPASPPEEAQRNR